VLRAPYKKKNVEESTRALFFNPEKKTQPCKWDEVLDEEFLFENTDENVQILTDRYAECRKSS
jgi:hypothetical protein